MASRWWSWGWQDVNENGRANPIPPSSFQYWDNYEYSAQLTAFPPDVNIIQVACGEVSGVAVDDEGNVWVWGQGRYTTSPAPRSVFGDAINSLPTYPSVAPPFMLPYPEATDVVEVTMTNRSTFWRNSSGEVYGVGLNRDGEFGLGEAAGTYHGTPVKITTLPAAIVHIFAWVDGQGLYAIDTAGAVWYAGFDRYGMSGSGVMGTSSTRVLTFATIGGVFTPDTSVQPDVVASGNLTFDFSSTGDSGGFWAFGVAGTIPSFTITGDLPTLVVVLSSADAYNPSYYSFSVSTPSSEFITLTNDVDASAGVPGSPTGFVAAWTATDARLAEGGTLIVSHWIFDSLVTGDITRDTRGSLTWAAIDGGPEVYVQYWGSGATPGEVPPSQPTVPGSTPKAITLACIGQATANPTLYLDPDEAAIGWAMVAQGASTPANRRSAIASQPLTAIGSWPGVMGDFAEAEEECWSATVTKSTVGWIDPDPGYGPVNVARTEGYNPELTPGDVVYELPRPHPDLEPDPPVGLAKRVQPGWIRIRTSATFPDTTPQSASYDFGVDWWGADGTYFGGTGMLDNVHINLAFGPYTDDASNPVQHPSNNINFVDHGNDEGYIGIYQTLGPYGTAMRDVTLTVAIDCAVVGGTSTANSFNIGIYCQAPVTTTPLLGVKALAMTERPFSDGVSSGASTFALMEDGTIMFWGRSMTESPALNVAYVPTVVPDITGIKEIYGSDGNECVYFLTEDGMVLGLGTDNDGALVNGAFDVDDPTWYLEEDHFALPPVTIEIPGDKEVLHLARGSSFTTAMMVVTADGELWGWGYNSGAEWGYSDPNIDVVEKVPPQRIYPNYFSPDDEALQVTIMMENAVFVEREQHSFGIYHGLDDTGGYTYDGCHVRWGFPNSGDSDSNWDLIPGGRDVAWGVMAPPEDTNTVFAWMLDAVEERPEVPSDVEDRLFVSDDKGQTWTMLPSPPTGDEAWDSTKLAARSRDEIYALVAEFDAQIIYKSIDGGETWSAFATTRHGHSIVLTNEYLWWCERAQDVLDDTHWWRHPQNPTSISGANFITWDVRRCLLDGTGQELVWSVQYHTESSAAGFALRAYTGGDEWVLGVSEGATYWGNYYRIHRPIKSYAGTYSAAVSGTGSPVDVLGTPSAPLIWSPSVQPMDKVQLRAEITTPGSTTNASRFDIYFTNNSLAVVGSASVTAYATPPAPGATPIAIGMFSIPATGQRFYVQHTSVGGPATGRVATIEVVMSHWQTQEIGPYDRALSVAAPVVPADYAPGQIEGGAAYAGGFSNPNGQGFYFLAARSMRRGWESATWRIWQEPIAGWPLLNWEAVLVFVDCAAVNVSPHTFSELKMTVPSSGATADYSTDSLGYDMDDDARNRIERVMLFGRPTGTFTGFPKTKIKVNIYSYEGLVRPIERQWDILPLSASTYVAITDYERAPFVPGVGSPFRAMIMRTEDYGATWSDKRMLVGHETPTAFSVGSADGVYQIAAPRLNGQQEVYIVGGVGQDGLPPAGDPDDPESSSPLVTWHSFDQGETWGSLYHESHPVDSDGYFMFYGPRTIDGGPRVTLRGCGPVPPGARRLRRPWVAG